MPRFRYAALDTRGRSIAGEVLAADGRQALTRVRELGHFPTALSEVSPVPSKRLRGRVSAADIALCVRQLANLVGAGLPVHRSLVVLTEQTDSPTLRALLEEARAEVRAGGSLSSAMSRFPGAFSPLAINLVRTGESTGRLDESLARLADLMEKSLQRRAQIVSALIYPALLTVVALGAVIFLLTFLLPRLGLIFRDFEAALPVPTLLLMGLGNALRAGWWAVFALLAGAVAGAWYFGWRGGWGGWERWLRGLPAVRRLLDRIVAARFSRTLGTLLAGGVAILDGLEIAGTSAGSRLVSEAIGRAREQVREGLPLAAALNRVGGFLPVLVHVAAVGEETGKLPDLLLRLADSLDFEVDTSLRRLVSLLEPAVILIMGVMVGFIVLAILLPIFSLGSIVGQ